MSKPTFSICIPNYNYARFIGDTIQSVLDQTYSHFEIIVVDNASTDNSIEVVEKFQDERIRLIKNRYNIGFAPNLQRATMYANYDFINLLSSDDRLKPDALETYAEVLRSRGDRASRTVLMSDVEVIDSGGDPLYTIATDIDSYESAVGGYADDGLNNTLEVTVLRGHDVLATTLRQLRTFAPFLSIVYPKVLWKAIEGYNSVRTVGPDKHFNYKLLSQDPDIVYVRKTLFEYRVHQSPNEKAQQQTLKRQIDDYLYTTEFSDDFLASLGLLRDDLVRALLDNVCLKNGLTQLVYGTYTQAVRMLAFSFASYPKETLKRPRAYVLATLLMLGPIGKIIAKPLYALYRRLNGTGERFRKIKA
ncbi:MAG: glycosyltransferase [Rhodothermales bacterium]